MPLTCHAARSVSEDVEASIALVTTEAVEAGLDGLDVDGFMLDSTGFEGKADQVYSQPAAGRVLGLVGLGPVADVTADTLRRAGAAVARTWKRHIRVAVATDAAGDLGVGEADVRRALAEGILLGGYRYTAFKSKNASHDGADEASGGAGEYRLRRVDITGSTAESAVTALARAAAISAGVCLARDLVNEPGGSLTSPVLARRAVSLAREAGLICEVWDEEKIRRERLGGLLGVNRGSAQPPRFVRLTYRPDPHSSPAATLALVGKGLTFDAGGLSIKTAQGMMTMKMDMAGAAAVLGTMSALPAIAPRVAVHAYLPMTDNMLGGDATRPGDVLTIRGGQTIEVANTDAEGRLVLADALSLASEDAPDAIVDLATLTGACMVALGPRIAGLMGNDESWIARVRRSAESAGERVWPLPLPSDYEQQFKSEVADMKNIGTVNGGALTAGLILQKFVAEGIPWAHLDIAGPAFSDADDGEICKGGTGFGVRTLIELIDGLSESGPPAPAPSTAA